MKYLFLVLCALFCFSCEPYNEELIPLAGVYEGVVVGQPNVFTMSVAVEGNDILIDAPFDGFGFSLLVVDVDNEDRDVVDLEFCNQEIYQDVSICGMGYYSYGDLQLDYELDFGDFTDSYTLVASKF